MSGTLRVRLSAMMFLQYAIWGLWAPILGIYLGGLESFNGDPFKIGLIYMTMPIASIIAPFIGGQIADRYFAAQRFLAVSQIIGGLLLLVVTQLTGFIPIFIGMLAYNLIYAPTIALTNSIAFQHWPNNEFSKIRMWGSIGWIVIGWVFGVLWMRYVGKMFHTPAMVDCLYLAAAVSLIYGVFAICLPHTPPSKQAANPWAFLDAIKLMNNRAFAVMAIISFLVAIELQFYFIWTQSYLNTAGGPFEAKQIVKSLQPAGSTEDPKQLEAIIVKMVEAGDENADRKLSRKELEKISATTPPAKRFLESQNQILAEKGGQGLDEADVSPVLTFGQICEMIMMALLPLALRRLGFRATMALGIAAWALRDFVFSIGHPTSMVIAAIPLHGIGFAFFFTTIFMFTDIVAPKDIKSSAQGFLASVSIGCGMLVGSLLQSHVITLVNGNWHRAYLIPGILCTACCVIFLIGFKYKPAENNPA